MVGDPQVDNGPEELKEEQAEEEPAPLLEPISILVRNAFRVNGNWTEAK